MYFEQSSFIHRNTFLANFVYSEIHFKIYLNFFINNFFLPIGNIYMNHLKGCMSLKPPYSAVYAFWVK